MASLRKRGHLWYARVSLWDGYRQREKEIPLQTNSKTTARTRLSEVNRNEEDIKNGVNISFAWQNTDGIIKYKQLSILDVSQQFLASRKTLGLAESTIKRNLHSLNLFMSIIGKSIPIESITTKHIEVFKNYCICPPLSHLPQGINIDLRLLKTFFRWCVRNETKLSMPYIEMIKIPQSLPSYIAEFEWSKLMNSNILNEIDKTTFQFALGTGCRLSEPYYGKIDGHWMVIPAEHTKSKIEKEIFLSDELIGMYYKMHNHLLKWLDHGYKLENYTGRISKRFLKVCRSVNIKHRFHDIRHTFAVRRYLVTRDIYQVKKELCHISVTTTEKYAKFSLRRLAHDFPSLARNRQNKLKTAIMDTDCMDIGNGLPTTQQ